MKMIGECEMTGRRNVELFRVKIEGTIMNVCKECVKYGERVDKPTSFKTKSYARKKDNSQDNSFIVKDYASRIKQARESKKLTQEELAKKLNEKESLLHKIESNHLKPNFPLARKLGKFFGIQLIETIDEKTVTTTSRTDDGPLTMEAALLAAMKKKK